MSLPPHSPSHSSPKDFSSGESQLVNQVSQEPTVTILAAVLALLLGLSRAGGLFTAFRLLNPQVLFSLGGIVALAGLAVTAGLLVVGFGLLMRVPWATQLGLVVALLYFLLVAVGLLMTLVGIVNSKNPSVFLGAIVVSFPRMVSEAAGPALLIYLHLNRSPHADSDSV